MSSTEVLEANVASIRVDLNELKTDFRAAVARIDSDIKTAVTKLEAEIRAMGAKAEKDLHQFADRVEAQFSTMRADNNRFADRVQTQFSELREDISGLRGNNNSLREKVDSLREKVDANFQTLFTKIDTDIKGTHQMIGELSKAISNLTATVLKIDSRLSAITWVGGGLIALVTVAITVGNAFEWF